MGDVVKGVLLLLGLTLCSWCLCFTNKLIELRDATTLEATLNRFKPDAFLGTVSGTGEGDLDCSLSVPGELLSFVLRGRVKALVRGGCVLVPPLLILTDSSRSC